MKTVFNSNSLIKALVKNNQARVCELLHGFILYQRLDKSLTPFSWNDLNKNNLPKFDQAEIVFGKQFDMLDDILKSTYKNLLH